MKGIGGLIIIGLITWAISRARLVEAAEAEETGPSLYERMHTTVPITKRVARKFDVYRNIEEYRETNHAGA